MNRAPREPAAHARRTRSMAHQAARLPTTYAAAASALQSAFLANGGAAIALLTLYGSLLLKDSQHPALHGLAQALLALVNGIGLAAVATGLSFMAQYGYLMRHRSWLGRIAFALTMTNMTLVFASLVSFVVGGVLAFCALG